MFGWFKKKPVIQLSESDINQKIVDELERHSKIVRDNPDKFMFNKRSSGIMEYRLKYGKYTYWVDVIKRWNKFELYALTIGKYYGFEFECTRTMVSKTYHKEVEDYFANKSEGLWVNPVIRTETESKERMKRVFGI